jgi:Regulator of ribonuclease activity B
MDALQQFPSDENGDVFRRMVSNGDDLSKPRIIDFCHIFSEQKQALAFAEEIDDHELEVCVSYYEARDMWQVIIKRHMIPTHQDVTLLELSLAAKAESLGGESDGWGCMTVRKKETT